MTIRMQCPLSNSWAPRGYDGTCPKCGKRAAVRVDGKLARHWVRIDGSRYPEAAVSVEAEQ